MEAMNANDNEPLTPDEQAEFERLEASFTPADYDALERALHLRANVIGWTGDPLKQPARAVLNAARSVVSASS